MSYLAAMLVLSLFYMITIAEVSLARRRMVTKTVFLNSPWVKGLRHILALLTLGYILIFLFWLQSQGHPITKPEYYLFLVLVIVFNLVEIIIILESKRLKTIFYIFTPIVNVTICLLISGQLDRWLS